MNISHQDLLMLRQHKLNLSYSFSSPHFVFVHHSMMYSMHNEIDTMNEVIFLNMQILKIYDLIAHFQEYSIEPD